MKELPRDLPLWVECQLQRIVGELPVGWPPDSLVIRVVIRGTEAHLRLGPPTETLEIGSKPRKLSECQRTVLEAVQVEVDRLRRRVQGVEVRAVMWAAGHRWGKTKIDQALADLVRGGLLVNDNDKRGYGLPDPS